MGEIWQMTIAIRVTTRSSNADRDQLLYEDLTMAINTALSLRCSSALHRSVQSLVRSLWDGYRVRDGERNVRHHTCTPTPFRLETSSKLVLRNNDKRSFASTKRTNPIILVASSQLKRGETKQLELKKKKQRKKNVGPTFSNKFVLMLVLNHRR